LPFAPNRHLTVVSNAFSGKQSLILAWLSGRIFGVR